jgi:hypothetical protein
MVLINEINERVITSRLSDQYVGRVLIIFCGGAVLQVEAQE